MPKITDIKYDTFSLRLPVDVNKGLKALSGTYSRPRNQAATMMIALVLSDPELQKRCFGTAPPQ